MKIFILKKGKIKMKEIKHYICEICGTEYNDKKRCNNCELGHVRPVEICQARYIAISDNAKGYPLSISIKMEDGKIVIYKR